MVQFFWQDNVVGVSNSLSECMDVMLAADSKDQSQTCLISPRWSYMCSTDDRLAELWVRLQQEKRKEQLEALEKAIVAKETTWQRLNGGQGKINEIKARFDQELKQLQDQRDELQAERSQLIRVTQHLPSVITPI